MNGLLPDVMNELYTTNDQIHNHFTRQCYFVHINKGHSNVYARSFRNISMWIWKTVHKKMMLMCHKLNTKVHLNFYSWNMTLKECMQSEKALIYYIIV